MVLCRLNCSRPSTHSLSGAPSFSTGFRWSRALNPGTQSSSARLPGALGACLPAALSNGKPQKRECRRSPNQSSGAGPLAAPPRPAAVPSLGAGLRRPVPVPATLCCVRCDRAGTQSGECVDLRARRMPGAAEGRRDSAQEASAAGQPRCAAPPPPCRLCPPRPPLVLVLRPPPPPPPSLPLAASLSPLLPLLPLPAPPPLPLSPFLSGTKQREAAGGPGKPAPACEVWSSLQPNGQPPAPAPAPAPGSSPRGDMLEEAPRARSRLRALWDACEGRSPSLLGL
ncbi:uncharacterized protein LOC132535574 isoform X2 [Erinaceus europaeus]|uniref:Uncharacterized protein LOC132535574 isoform X2 n=1 Tax=Erinaceus europaeus TaxID=9365 RepID=A0ABM3WNA1_ERIEU|nr:uncharacterized protein LOC132535574 isoform X2 [Erinaceus europaeus]